MQYVADSSFVLAVLLDEPCLPEAAIIAEQAELIMSAVNYAELVGKLTERGASLHAIKAGVVALRLTIQPFDEELAIAAGLLRNVTRIQGLSLGDRACLAAGQALQLPVLTMDQIWRDLPLDIDIRVMRS